MDNSGSVNPVKEGHKITITFHHPKGNSLPGCLLEKLKNEINKASADNEINVIVLRSEGNGAFCAGASFDELLSIGNLEEGKKFFMGFADLLNAMRESSKIIIAGVHSKVVGGGVGLVAACDYTIAVKSASVKLSELAIGIGPFIIAPAIERKVGKETLSAMTINYDWRSAEWAYSKGLYDDLVENIEELNTAVNLLAARLADSNPEAIKELRKIFWQGTENWQTLLEERAEISGKLVLSENTKRYIDGFRKNRA
jgi:methylglutaconyl-CoA hydratase